MLPIGFLFDLVQLFFPHNKFRAFPCYFAIDTVLPISAICDEKSENTILSEVKMRDFVKSWSRRLLVISYHALYLSFPPIS
jgi:hypothetical protein